MKHRKTYPILFEYNHQYDTENIIGVVVFGFVIFGFRLWLNRFGWGAGVMFLNFLFGIGAD